MKKNNYWEAIIGLEVHAQLNTQSKLFSSAPNRFGDEPNTNIHPVCTGMPGSLPVLNKEAVKKAVQFGLAIEATIAKQSKFDRKSYFYPDSPRNFQITQYDQPIILGGKIIAEVDGQEKSFAINRVHLEDDSGMLKHFPKFGGIDYNRAGVPLIEIVSEPCIRSPQEAMAFAMEIRAILQYLDASDCNMEEGSIRFDANISVRKKTETFFRTKTEIKNLNSFNNLQLALNIEIQKQIRAYEKHPDLPFSEVIRQDTYRWDAENKNIILMRRKEDAQDYRYFPEPDLVPIVLSDEFIEEIRLTLPELPLQRQRRYIKDYNLNPDSAFLLTSDKNLADYFETGLDYCQNPINLCNWILSEFTGRLKEKNVSIFQSGIPPENVALLVAMIDKGTVTGKIAKKIADEMVLDPQKNPKEIVANNPAYQPVHDIKQLESLVDEVLQNHQQSIQDFLAGKSRAFSFLVGQVMKLSHGKASPAIVNELLIKKIKHLKNKEY